MHEIIHDLKTERQNVSAGLPAGYKLVPASFYLVATASVFLSLYFYLSKKAHEAAEAEMRVRISDAKSEEATILALRANHPDAVVVSARTGKGIDELREVLEDRLPRPEVEVTALVPYTRGDLVDRIHKTGVIDTLEHIGDGVTERPDSALLAVHHDRDGLAECAVGGGATADDQHDRQVEGDQRS